MSKCHFAFYLHTNLNLTTFFHHKRKQVISGTAFEVDIQILGRLVVKLLNLLREEG